MEPPSPPILRRLSTLGLLLGLACSGGAPTAPTPAPAPAPAPGAPQAAPGEIALGDTPLSWVQVDQKDGAWVRWKPCMAAVGSLRIDPTGRKVVWDVGQEVMEYTLVSGLLVDADTTLAVTNAGSPETLVLHQVGDGRVTLTTPMGTWTFAPASDVARYPERAEKDCEG